MLNLLIVDDNLCFAKILINYISNTDNNFNLCTIATDGKEALEKLKNKKFDIILLDLSLPKYNGINILKILQNEYSEIYKNSVIVISNRQDLLLKVRNNNCVYSYISKIYGMDAIMEHITKLEKIKYRNNTINILINNITEELLKINYNMTYSGTKYILESIMLIIQQNKISEFNLSKDILPLLAQKYKKSPNNIKMCINNATENMFCDCEQKILNEYFGFQVQDKPKTKLIINTIISKLYSKGTA